MISSQLADKYKYITPNIESSYSDLKLISETLLYYLYEGKYKHHPYPTHTIRAFNFNSEFAKENYDAAASLFIKELLHLISIDPNSVLVSTFEMNDKKMAFAALSYAPISCHIKHYAQDLMMVEERKESTINPSEFSDISGIKDMISDLLLDVKFLSQELKIKDCSGLLVPQSIYKFKESRIYFVGDWLTAIKSDSHDTVETGKNLKQPSSSDIPDEMLALGLSIIELNEVHPEIVKGLKEIILKEQITFKTTLKEIFYSKGLENMSKECKRLLERMLDSNLNLRPKAEEFEGQNSARRRKLPKENDSFEINLEKSGLTAKDMDFLITKVMTKWTNLKLLNLRGNEIGNNGVETLSTKNLWKNLTTLDLQSNKIGEEGAAALSKNSAWTKLAVLDLKMNKICDKGATALSNNSSWINLTTLYLSHNNISAAGATALGKNSSWTNLKIFDLSNNNIGAEGTTGFSKNSSWTNLKIFDLSINYIGAKGAKVLSKNSSWKALETLDLHDNNIDAEGATELGKNSSWTNLTTLHLDSNNVGAEGARGLCKNSSWTNLTHYI